MDYYANKGVTTDNTSTLIKKNNGSNSSWWLRSLPSTDDGAFYLVKNNGNYGYGYCRNAFGVSPAFRLK